MVAHVLCDCSIIYLCLLSTVCYTAPLTLYQSRSYIIPLSVSLSHTSLPHIQLPPASPGQVYSTGISLFRLNMSTGKYCPVPIKSPMSLSIVFFTLMHRFLRGTTRSGGRIYFRQNFDFQFQLGGLGLIGKSSYLSGVLIPKMHVTDVH